MKKLVLLSILLAVTVVAAAEEPVLKVNATVFSDVDFALAKRTAAAMLKDAAADEPTITRNAVDQLISRALVLELAGKAGIEVAKEDVDKGIESQTAAAGGAAQWEGALKAAGIGVEKMRSLERERLATDRYVQQVVLPAVRVDEGAAKAYFESHLEEFQHPEQVRLKMILASVAPHASTDQVDAAKARAERAKARLESGESFAAVAEELSDDSSRTRGGEVGWVRKGLLLPELEAATWDLPVDTTSPIVHSKFGFHIFLVAGRRDAGTLEWDEVSDGLRRYLTNRKVQERLGEMVRSARAEAKIEGLTVEVKTALAPLPLPQPEDGSS